MLESKLSPNVSSGQWKQNFPYCSQQQPPPRSANISNFQVHQTKFDALKVYFMKIYNGPKQLRAPLKAAFFCKCHSADQIFINLYFSGIMCHPCCAYESWTFNYWFFPPFKSRGLVSCQVSSNLPAFVPLVSEAVAGCFCYMQMLMQKMKMTLKKNLIGVFFHNNYKDGVERKNVSYCKISKGRKRSFQVKY